MGLFTNAAERLDRRCGWDKLPLPLAMLDPDRAAQPPAREEPLRHRPRAARQAGRRRPPALPDRAHARRHVQRPRRPADGQPRQPLRPQRPARVHRARAGGQAARAEPAARQPRAPDARRSSSPATTLNLLAGAWIQFEVHDWFSHGKNEAENPWVVPLDDDDPWPEHPMQIQRTRRDPSADPSGPPTFVTDDTHWWDGSQIYGRDPAFAARAALGRAREAADRRARPAAAGPRGARRPHRRRGQLLGRPRAPALALHARAQRDLRPPARDASGARRTTSSTTRRGSSSRR